LSDVARVGADHVVCLGDLVGYGADPGPVVDALQARDPLVVVGNHDCASVGLADLEWFNSHARRAAEWTAGQLAPDQARYLAGLPLLLEHEEATFVHASPRSPSEWPYLVSADDGAEAFSAVRTRLAFVGHSHVPAVWAFAPDGGVRFRRGGGGTRLDPEARYLLNVGSVGQPRDGDPDAAYAVWDREASTVEIRRVPYDVAEARRRIHAAGLPRILGDRLLRGR
jgi:diadenosine tetraphosphatase ApaH/serine/threonine PP2A family protein phosphatase